MLDKSRQLTIIGARDSWTYELMDVANLMGYEPSLISMIEENASSSPLSLQFLDIRAIQSVEAVFTGYEPIHSDTGWSHPKKVQQSRKFLIQQQREFGINTWINLLHPSAWISPTASLQVDIFIGANSSVGSNSQVDSHVTINRNASIGHNVSLGLGSEIGPMCAVSSGARIGAWSFLGPGAVILNDVVIGEDAVIGAGSVVAKNVREGTTVIGVPAREI